MPPKRTVTLLQFHVSYTFFRASLFLNDALMIVIGDGGDGGDGGSAGGVGTDGKLVLISVHPSGGIVDELRGLQIAK